MPQLPESSQKGLMKAFKTFIKSFKALQRSVKTKLYIILGRPYHFNFFKGCWSILEYFVPNTTTFFASEYSPFVIYMFEVSNGNTRTMHKFCSKLIIKTPEHYHWRLPLSLFWIDFTHWSDISIDDLEKSKSRLIDSGYIICSNWIFC